MSPARRAPNALLGALKGLGLLLALPWLGLWWFLWACIARSRLRQELITAGVPEEAARRLAQRYRLDLLHIVRHASATH